MITPAATKIYQPSLQCSTHLENNHGHMTRFHTLAIFLSSLVAFAGAQARADHFKVILLGGQSNMEGSGTVVAELPALYQTPQNDVLLYSSDKDYSAEFTTLRPGSGGAFGPELSFGRALADAYPHEKFCLIKGARGATALCAHWKAPTGETYRNFKTTVAQGLEALTRSGHTHQIVGMLWTQGETDATNGRTTAQYQADLTGLIADVRANFGANLPFFISRLSVLQTRVPNITLVRAAQENVAAAVPHAYLIDTDSFSLRSDNLHFSSLGQVALGKAFAQSYQKSLPAKAAAAVAVEPKANRSIRFSEKVRLASETLIDGSRIIATASSCNDSTWQPVRTIDQSGLSAGEHSSAKGTGWATLFKDPATHWIQWDLGASYILDSIHVWNLNNSGSTTGGVRAVDIYYSNTPYPGDPEGDGTTNWTRLGGKTLELPQAPDGSPNLGFDLATATSTSLPATEVRYIRFELNTNWGAASNRSGLSEIQFIAKPSNPAPQSRQSVR